MNHAETALTRHAGIEIPLLCGAMYPCSNPELIAAVSEAGGMGIIQPISKLHFQILREAVAIETRARQRSSSLDVTIEVGPSIYHQFFYQ